MVEYICVRAYLRRVCTLDDIYFKEVDTGNDTFLPTVWHREVGRVTLFTIDRLCKAHPIFAPPNLCHPVQYLLSKTKMDIIIMTHGYFYCQ